MISVCMATYNGEKFIKEQIDSILSQLDSNDELIISDDGSTDKTLDLISSYKDSRIKIYHNNKTSYLKNLKYAKSFYYATANFENALKHAIGDYIFLADQDDVWASNRVRKMVKELEQVGCVACKRKFTDINGNIISAPFSDRIVSHSLLSNLLRRPFIGCCMAFRKDILKIILPFPKKLVAHDLWIGLLCVYLKEFKQLSDYLLYYRLHNDSVTQGGNVENPLIFKVYYRVMIALQLVNRCFKLYFNIL